MRRTGWMQVLLGFWTLVLGILLFGVLDSLPKRLQIEGGWHQCVLDLSVAAALLVPLWYVGKWQGSRKSRGENRRRAREEMEIRSLHNDLILQMASDGIFGVDTEGRMIFINPAGARMLGYEPSELIGLYSHEMFHHTNANGDPCSSKECRIQLSMQELRMEMQSDEVFWRKDDTSFPVEYSSVPILWQGTVAGAVVTFRDLTERKKTEELMRRSDPLSVVGELRS